MPQKNAERYGGLFINHPEEGRTLSPKSPGYTGRCTINGVEYKISAWVHKASQQAKHPGEQYLNLKFEPMPDQQGSDQCQSQPTDGQRSF